MVLKDKVFSGYHGKCHCQGIAVDLAGGYIYYSFTTKLVKSDLEGNIVGCVDHMIGHLGCIAFNRADGRVYASLEYKNDAVGRGILSALSLEGQHGRDGFYIAIFDADRIDRTDMDAETDGVMKAVYLPTVLEDYRAVVSINGREHRHAYGCSGIDGVTVGPDFGAPGGKPYLSVCYGIYSDTERVDNDHQVILQYDFERWWDEVAEPLTQSRMHTSGPLQPRRKYFLYTGNTTYGVQNFEYDAFTGDYFLCVYPGKKAGFPNYPMYVIDGSAPARQDSLTGCGEASTGLVLTLRETGCSQNGISGMEFPHGSTGFCSLGNGEFCVSHHFSDPEKGHATTLCRYSLLRDNGRWRFVPPADRIDLREAGVV